MFSFLDTNVCYSIGEYIIVLCAYDRSEAINPSACKIIIDKTSPSLSRTLRSEYDCSLPYLQMYLNYIMDKLCSAISFSYTCCWKCYKDNTSFDTFLFALLGYSSIALKELLAYTV